MSKPNDTNSNCAAEYSDNYSFRIADISDIDTINQMMNQIYDGVTDKRLFVKTEPEVVSKIVSGDGFAVLAIDNNISDSSSSESISSTIAKKVIGFVLMWYPGDDPENLGPDADLDESEWNKVAMVESAVVMPAARGHHLERRMIDFAEGCVAPEYKYLIATVSPYNPASYKSAESLGYKHVKTKEKYGGLDRRVYMKIIK